MVFLDLDNTLLPTRMDQILGIQTGMDVYQACKPSLKQLQHSIICAIAKLKSTIESKNEKMVICIVSNANKRWIRDHLSSLPDSKGFTILGMFRLNLISVYFRLPHSHFPMHCIQNSR